MRRPTLVLVAVCTGWGTVGLLVRAVPLPAAAITCARIWVAAAGLALAIRLDRRPGVTLFSYRPGRVVLTGVVLAVHWLAFVSAVQRAPIGTVTLIVFLAPVGVALAAPKALGERAGRTTLVALVVAVLGSVLVSAPAARATGALGVGLAAFAALSLVALVLISKPLATVYGGLRLACCEMVVAGLTLLPLGLAAGWGSPRASWLWLVVLGLVHTAGGAALYLSSLARVPAVHAGILGYLEPAAAVLLGWAFLSEAPTWATLAGGVLIVVAGAIVVRSPAAEPEVVGVVG